MIRITANQNPVIKEVRSLKNNSSREEKGLYFIEGSRFVSEALKEREAIRYIIFSETFYTDRTQQQLIRDACQAAADCYTVPDKLFEAMSDTQNPQGILGVLELHRRPLKDASFASVKGEDAVTDGLLLILESIKDPGNLGTIIRSADASGCRGIILPEGCVDLFNPKVLRSTMGSVFHVPIYHCECIESAVNFVREAGFAVYASCLEGSESIYNTDLSGKVALVVGSEADGISPWTMKHADRLIRIPMEGRAESLNASTAASVMMFEAMRQRGGT